METVERLEIIREGLLPIKAESINQVLEKVVPLIGDDMSFSIEITIDVTRNDYKTSTVITLAAGETRSKILVCEAPKPIVMKGK